MSDESLSRDELMRELAEARRRMAELEAVLAAEEKKETLYERRLADLSALYAMTTIVNQSLETDEILDRALDEVLTKVGIEAAAIVLLDEPTGELVTVAHRNISDDFLTKLGRLRVGEAWLGGRAVRTCLPVVIDPADPYFLKLVELGKNERIKAVASVPLIGRGGAIGVMNLGGAGREYFDEAGLELLVNVGREIATGVERARLHQNEFRAVAENAHDAILILVGAEGIIAYANPRVSQASGYSLEELIGESFGKVVSYDELPTAVERYRRRIAGEDIPRQNEMRIVRKDGSEVHAEIVSTKITWRGQPAVLAIVRDITDRIWAAQALRDSEEKFRTLVESSPDVVATVDENRRVTFMNRTPPGVAEEEVLGSDILHYATPGREDRLREALDHVFRAGEGRSFESMWVTPDGSPLHFATRIIPITHDGRVVSAMIVGTDITEHKRADEAVRESEEKLRSVVENSPDYIVMVDADLNITFMNRSPNPALGLDKIIGSNVTAWAAAEDHDKIRELLGHVFRTGESVTFEQVASRPGHRSVIFSVRAGCIKQNGRVAAAMIVATDITEHRRAEEALQASEEKLRALLENSPDIVFTVDRDLKITFINRVMPGYSVDRVQGTDATEFVAGR